MKRYVDESEGKATDLKDFGSHWDTRKIRNAREYGWFRQNEARLIEEARRRARSWIRRSPSLFLAGKIDAVAEEALLAHARALLKALEQRTGDRASSSPNSAGH